MIAGDDESGPIDVSVRKILSAEPANVMYVPAVGVGWLFCRGRLRLGCRAACRLAMSPVDAQAASEPGHTSLLSRNSALLPFPIVSPTPLNTWKVA